jgi:hypothetical protein
VHVIERRNLSLTRRPGVAIVLMGLAAASGCKASVKAEAKTSLGVDEPPADFDEPSNAPSGDEPTRANDLDAAAPALLGARQDVTLVAGKQSTTCHCLAVAAGAPSDTAFSWEAEAPTIDRQTQVVIAFTSAGTGCTDEPKETLGASYWGYLTSAEDVTVVVESARSGRPVTTGAVIPRPGPGGHVYVRPVDASVPYAKTEKDAQTGCVVNIPGA